MNTEVIHCQLDVELYVLPLAETSKLVTFEEFFEGFSFQVVEDLINVRLLMKDNSFPLLFTLPDLQFK